MTTASIAGFSAEEILHEALVAPRAALLPLPDTTILERPGLFQIVTPSLTRGGLNEVVSASIPEEEADAAIDLALAPYERHGLLFRWTILPGGRPADLGERLARRGLRRTESLVMARATGEPSAPRAEGITAEQVTLETVDDFTRVMAEGWEMDAEPLRSMNRRVLADPTGRHALFLARIGGRPAAVGACVALPRSVYLLGGVTIRDCRGRGLYRALVDARLRYAAARGLHLATTHAMAETSAPLLERMGFSCVCRVDVFRGTTSEG